MLMARYLLLPPVCSRIDWHVEVDLEMTCRALCASQRMDAVYRRGPSFFARDGESAGHAGQAGPAQAAAAQG